MKSFRSLIADKLRSIEQLSRRGELLLLGAIALAALGSRLLFWVLLPTHLWSKDGGSYSQGAFKWLATGEWFISGRRGPVYTMFIGYTTRLWNCLDGVIWSQHLLTCAAILFSVLCARLILGRRASWLIYLCGYAFAVEGIAMRFGHVIRNESLLFFFACMALGSWALALKNKSVFWLACAGLCAGLLSLTKNVFVPFPVMVLGSAAYLFWRTPARLLLHGAAFLAAFALPFGLQSWHNKTASWVDERQPQSGILFFGRTAQWTVLEGGIEPEYKKCIREDIEAYRKLPSLDNNLIINRTAVPHLRELFQEQGRSLVELDKLCQRFAFEAVRAQPALFAKQALGDLAALHFHLGNGVELPTQDELEGTAELVERLTLTSPFLDIAHAPPIIRASAAKDHFAWLELVQKTAWLFQFVPVTLTSLGLCWLLWRSRGEERLLWLGQAALWGFTMVLLSTVGRPLTRYLTPVLPIMFWTMTAVLLDLVRLFTTRFASVPVPVPLPEPAEI